MVETLSILNNIKSETKVKIICWILKKPLGLTVSELVKLTDKKRTNISKQINEMKNIGLLESEKKGKYINYKISNNLHKRQIQMIKEVANSFHVVDEGKKKLRHI